MKRHFYRAAKVRGYYVTFCGRRDVHLREGVGLCKSCARTANRLKARTRV